MIVFPPASQAAHQPKESCCSYGLKVLSGKAIANIVSGNILKKYKCISTLSKETGISRKVLRRAIVKALMAIPKRKNFLERERIKREVINFMERHEFCAENPNTELDDTVYPGKLLKVDDDKQEATVLFMEETQGKGDLFKWPLRDDVQDVEFEQSDGDYVELLETVFGGELIVMFVCNLLSLAIAAIAIAILIRTSAVLITSLEGLLPSH
ncbi:hypothetical protein DPMN_110213 [Dreissena polymorpha]|uniref:Uncharacterized protein n=1 Tax=Dreissena polymorpha TaxID=45954 RepID=A0A9D4QNP1_DREPO|nr:hypothetical protein DPMN_110213 [Dreissena polymorpha]